METCDFNVAEFEYGERLSCAERELDESCPACGRSYDAEFATIPFVDRLAVIALTLSDHPIVDGELRPCVKGWLIYPGVS